MIILLLAGSWQGTRIDTLLDKEDFYRWAIAASSLSRLGDTLEPVSSADDEAAMDDEVFIQFNELAESYLPDDIPIDEDYDLDDDDNPHSKLLRAVRQELDDEIYTMVSSDEFSDLRVEFTGYFNEGRIQSSGTQFKTSSIYNADTSVEGVGLTSLFFGFRTLAANFLWLQVENYWHEGQLHRMVPIMRTCVTLDPNFIDAYLLGAWHMAYNVTARLQPTPEGLKVYSEKYDKRLGIREEWYYMGIEFIKDGIRKNPRDYRLYFDLGYGIYANKLNDHPNAIRYLDEATRHRHNQWVPRMLYRSLYLNGQYEDAIEGWTHYGSLYPDNLAAKRFLRVNEGMLAESTSDDAAACQKAASEAAKSLRAQALAAQESGNMTRANELNAEAKEAEDVAVEMELLALEEFNKSNAIWDTLIRRSDDSIAHTRKILRAAKSMAADGRYYEAVSDLDFARWEYPVSFDEISNLIIDIKAEGGLPYTISEQLKLERDKDAAEHIKDSDSTKKIHRVECAYMEHE